MPFSMPAPENGTVVLNVQSEDLQNTWTVGSNFLSHTKNIKSEIKKYISSLKIGSHYKITFEVYDRVSCSLKVRMGEFQESDNITANGTFTSYFTIKNDRDRNLRFIADGILKIRNIKFEEKIFQVNTFTFDNVEKFENKSFTVSYSLHRKAWRSWHSYIPSYYLHNQHNFYAFENKSSQIWKFNQEGIYHNYFGKNYPCIFEYVPETSPQDRIFETLQLYTKARRWDTSLRQYIEDNLVTFSKIIAYNSRQCTGEQLIMVKDSQSPASAWYSQQTANTSGQIIASKEERNWNLNDFRDHLELYNSPMFTSKWEDIRFDYPIDKVQNNTVLSYTKNWQNLESLRDKFIVVRLKFDTFNNVNLILNYTTETELASIR